MSDVIYPMYLVDDYSEGAIDKKAWVEITAITSTPLDAIDWLVKEIEPDDEMRYVVVGTSHQRPSGYPVDNSDARSAEPLDTYGPCQAPGCVGGRVEVIDTIVGPDVHAAWFDRQRGFELTPDRKKRIEANGGRVIETTRDNCEECYGTGKAGEFMFDSCEPMPWESCEADHAEGKHFWNIELTDDVDAPLFPAGIPDVSEDQEKMDL